MLIKEVIKDAQKYAPDYLENLLEKNLECLKQITTPVNSLPLFNGSVEDDLTNFYNYINHFKIKLKNQKFIWQISMFLKIKKMLFILRREILRRKITQLVISLVLSFEYFCDDQKNNYK